MKVTIKLPASLEKVETEATTWGELREELEAKGIPAKKMRAVVGNTQVTLESKDAKLPDFDFYLFLNHKRTKAGVDVDSMSHAELRSAIRDLRNDTVYGEEAREFFGDYTHYTTEELVDSYVDWLEEYGPEAAAVIEPETEEGTTVEEFRIRINSAIEQLRNRFNDELDSLQQVVSDSPSFEELQAWEERIKRNIEE